MSIANEITRLQELRNNLRAKLIGLLGISSSADLEDCVNAVDGIANNGGITGSITTKSGQYSVPQGYHNGAGKVGIASTEQAKIIPENIKSGVTMLGVAGEYAGEDVDLQEKSITPTQNQQVVQPDSGYDGLSKVTVAPIPSSYAVVTGVNADAGDVLANKVFVNALGQEVAGTMPNNGAVAATINGTTVTSYTIPAGKHSGSGTVSLDGTIEAALAAI